MKDFLYLLDTKGNLDRIIVGKAGINEGEEGVEPFVFKNCRDIVSASDKIFILREGLWSEVWRIHRKGKIELTNLQDFSIQKALAYCYNGKDDKLLYHFTHFKYFKNRLILTNGNELNVYD